MSRTGLNPSEACRLQFTHMGVTICFVCVRERADELRLEGCLGQVVGATCLHPTDPIRASI